MKRILYTLIIMLAAISCSKQDELPPVLESLKLNYDNTIQLHVGDTIHLKAVATPSENQKNVRYYSCETQYYGIVDIEYYGDYVDDYVSYYENEYYIIKATEPGEIFITLKGYYYFDGIKHPDYYGYGSHQSHEWEFTCKIIVKESYSNGNNNNNDYGTSGISIQNVTATSVELYCTNSILNNYEYIEAYWTNNSDGLHYTTTIYLYSYEHSYKITGLTPDSNYNLTLYLYRYNNDSIEKYLSFSTEPLRVDMTMSLSKASTYDIAMVVTVDPESDEVKDLISYVGFELSESYDFYDYSTYSTSTDYYRYLDSYSLSMSSYYNYSYYYCRPYVTTNYGEKIYGKTYMLDLYSQTLN